MRVAAEPPAPALSRTGQILKAAEPSLAADLLELTKPRIAVMALITVAAGYLLGAAGDFHALTLLNTLLGAGLVAAGGAALNHYLERRPDARMHRTARRPLPSGRIRPAVALA